MGRQQLSAMANSNVEYNQVKCTTWSGHTVCHTLQYISTCWKGAKSTFRSFSKNLFWVRILIQGHGTIVVRFNMWSLIEFEKFGVVTKLLFWDDCYFLLLKASKRAVDFGQEANKDFWHEDSHARARWIHPASWCRCRSIRLLSRSLFPVMN